MAKKVYVMVTSPDPSAAQAVHRLLLSCLRSSDIRVRFGPDDREPPSRADLEDVDVLIQH